eukprot:155679_1
MIGLWLASQLPLNRTMSTSMSEVERDAKMRAKAQRHKQTKRERFRIQKWVHDVNRVFWQSRMNCDPMQNLDDPVIRCFIDSMKQYFGLDATQLFDGFPNKPPKPQSHQHPLFSAKQLSKMMNIQPSIQVLKSVDEYLREIKTSTGCVSPFRTQPDDLSMKTESDPFAELRFDHESANVKEERDDNTNGSIKINNSTVKTHSSHYPGPASCIIYWDYEHNPIPHGNQLRGIIRTIKSKICDHIGFKPIHVRIYTNTSSSRLTRKLREEFDINGVQHIHTASADKRILIDIALKLYELEKIKTSNCIGLISNNDDFVHLLSQIHQQPPISHLLLLSITNAINPHLSRNVDCAIHIPLTTQDAPQPHKHKSKPMDVGDDDDEVCVILQELNTNHTVRYTIDRTHKIKTIRRIVLASIYSRGDMGEFVLIHKGKRLINNSIAHDYNISEGDTITWCLEHMHSIAVYAQSLSGHKSNVISVPVTARISCIKKEIVKQGLGSKKITLFYNGKELDSGECVAVYGIVNYQTIIFCQKTERKQDAIRMSTLQQTTYNEDHDDDPDVIIIDKPRLEHTNNKPVAVSMYSNTEMPALQLDSNPYL